jgi:hypothetical protein
MTDPDGITFSVKRDDDLPAKLRLAAATAPEIQMVFDAASALKLARRIEDTRPVVLVVEREVAPVAFWWFWAVLVGFAVSATVLPPALWLARMFQ